MHRGSRPTAAEVVDRFDDLLRHPARLQDKERYTGGENENPGAAVDVSHIPLSYSVFLTFSWLAPILSISLK